jgi:transcriptional regulator with XRE-family HTH domain
MEVWSERVLLTGRVIARDRLLAIVGLVRRGEVTLVGDRREALATRRELMGFTQEAFAAAVGVEFSTVGRWERGHLTPQPWRRHRIAAVLQVSLERLEELLVSAAPPTGSHDAAPASSGGKLEPDVVARDARDAAGFVRDVTASRVSDAALEQIQHDIHRCSTEYVTRPLAELFNEIRQVRSEVFHLVRNNRLPNQMRQLYLEAGRASGLQAHVCLDLGDYSTAQVHAGTAFLCADLADHHDMRAWVRGLQSLIAYWDGRLADAVMFARDGSRFPLSGSIAARLPGLEARACAALGDREGTVAALDRAEEAREAGRADEEVGVFTFPLAKQAVYAGTALLTLRDKDFAARAIGQSSFALELYQAAAPADRSSGDMLAARLDLAATHLLRNDLDAVDAHLTIVLAVPQARRTASIVKRANDIGARIKRSRFAASRQGRQLSAEVTAFCVPPPALPAAGSA